MRIRDNKVTATLLAAVVVVGGVNMAAYAGGGKAFLLGKHNTEKHTSVLKNKHKGAALQLMTKKSSPPLKVNSKTLVKHLNADTVDGVSSGALKTKMWTFPITAQGELNSCDLTFGPLPAGHYRVEYSIVVNDVGDGYGECQIKSGATAVGGEVSLASDSASQQVSGYVSLVDVGANGTLALVCTSSGTSFSVPAFGSRAYVHAARIDTVAQGTSTLN